MASPADGRGSISQPTHGTVRMNGNQILYVPKSDFCGFDEFTYTIYTADDSCSAPATVGVDVRCEPEPEQGSITDSPSKEPTSEPTVPEPTVPEVIPVANNDYAVVEQGSSVVIFVLANDVIPKGKVVSHFVFIISELTTPLPRCIDANGRFGVPENGTIEKGAAELIYTPNAGFCGDDLFTYTLFNDKHSSTATVTVEVTCDETTTTVATTSTSVTSTSVATTTAPTKGEEDFGDSPTVDDSNPQEDTVEANDDFGNGVEDTPLSIPVLANDIIPDGASGAFGTPLHGSITDVTESGLIYMPAEGYCGPDEFIYEIYFGDRTESAVVRVDIACVGAEFVDEYSSPAPSVTVISFNTPDPTNPSELSMGTESLLVEDVVDQEPVAVNDEVTIGQDSDIVSVNVLEK